MPFTRRRFLLSLAALGLSASGGSTLWSRFMPHYRGPITDHFNGVHFFDPDGSPPKKLSDVLRWRLTADQQKWPERAPSPFADTPPQRVTSGMRFSFIGHASWLVQVAGLNILIDPLWSERASPFSFAGPKRVNEPGVAFEKLPHIDVVLVSHGHYDHLDVETLARLHKAFAPRVITPLGNDLTMMAHDRAIKAEAFDWNDRVELGNGISVTLVSTRHWTARGVFDRNKSLWASFVIDTPAGKIYAVGDSGYGDGVHFRRVRDAHGPLKFALLPIGAYEPRWFMRDQHMNPDDAVKAFADCGAGCALAHHHGTIQLTDEAIDQPVKDLAVALDAAGVSRDKFLALKPGQVFELPA
jgi:L-ascorbate metabolism protein UlaG (beta-lactamase superfamily)